MQDDYASAKNLYEFMKLPAPKKPVKQSLLDEQYTGEEIAGILGLADNVLDKHRE